MPIAQIEPPTQTSFRVELYWLPLGAGDNTHCVRTNGRIFEAVAARAQHRDRRDLYHSALEVRLGVERYVIEMAPVWSPDNPAHCGVCEGPVGMRGLGRSRLFRYEVRRWRDGVIPDASAAVDGPISVKTDPARAARLIELVPLFPPPRGVATSWPPGYVELQLAGLVAARLQRPRHQHHRSARPWTSAGMGLRTGRRRPPKRVREGNSRRGDQFFRLAAAVANAMLDQLLHQRVHAGRSVLEVAR